jgi:dihydrofolate reductase
MGLKTFEFFGNKPLRGLLKFFITRKKYFNRPDIAVVDSLDNAIAFAKKNNYKELFICGGGEIYKQSMDKVDKILLTRVHTVVSEADTFFPAINQNIFKLIAEENFAQDDKHAYAYSFQTWIKK